MCDRVDDEDAELCKNISRPDEWVLFDGTENQLLGGRRDDDIYLVYYRCDKTSRMVSRWIRSTEEETRKKDTFFVALFRE